jgi:Metallo-beta-lactamase superfamily
MKLFSNQIHFYTRLFTAWCCCICLSSFVYAQNERLEIHHINVENGDATLITIHNTLANTFSAKVLIDGGNSGTGVYLKPYFNNLFGVPLAGQKVNYMILSHFHADHYRGLQGIGSGSAVDAIRADSVIDPGGYFFAGKKYGNLNPPDYADRGGSGAGDYTEAIKAAYNKGFLKARSKTITGFPGDIGKSINIGTVNGVPVTLTCIAGAGYSYGAGGAVINNGGTKPSRTNQNNFSLGFVLQYGQFRYYTSGDMGGYQTDKCTKYIDQETDVDKGIDYLFPGLSFPFDDNVSDKDGVFGHVCSFKVSHHGSGCSSNDVFLKRTAAAIFISVGNQPKWGLPEPGFVNRVKAEWSPLSEWATENRPLGVNNQGVYFTNLYDFTAGRQSLDACVKAFAAEDSINFSYGNDYDDHGMPGGDGMWESSQDQNCKDSYVLIVDPASINTQSMFVVNRVNYNKHVDVRMSAFQCHKTTAPDAMDLSSNKSIKITIPVGDTGIISK